MQEKWAWKLQKGFFFFLIQVNLQHQGPSAQTDCRGEMDSSSSNKQHKYLILAFNGPKCGVQRHVNESAKWFIIVTAAVCSRRETGGSQPAPRKAAIDPYTDSQWDHECVRVRDGTIRAKTGRSNKEEGVRREKCKPRVSIKVNVSHPCFLRYFSAELIIPAWYWFPLCLAPSTLPSCCRESTMAALWWVIVLGTEKQ